MSDKLDEAVKVGARFWQVGRLKTNEQTAKKHEREANLLRQRIEELEPMLTETQQERFALQKQSEQQRQERTELLLQVYKDVNKFLGTDVGYNCRAHMNMR